MTTRTPPTLPLVAYAEALCDKARVLVVGDASTELARAVLERGARLVHVCDRDVARRTEAQAKTSERTISFGGLDDGPATLRDSFFDLCLFENLALEPNPAQTLSVIKRLLAPRGVLLVSTPNQDSEQPLLAGERGAATLDYYSLYDSVIAHFPAVRMLGQVPFAGYAIVDFSAEGEPSPVLDTSLVPPRGEEPDYYIALAGRERRLLEQYVVVELPLAAIRGQAVPQEAQAPQAAPDGDLARRLAQQEQWIAELEARATTADERADAADERADAAEQRVAEVEQRLEADARRAGAAERRADSEARRAEVAERALAELKLKLDTLDRAWNEERAGLVREQAAPRAELEQRLGQISELQRALSAKTTELASFTADDESVRELLALETQLRERGERVATLERALTECERVGRELVRKLRNAEGGEVAQALAERLALAEADIVSLRWSLSMSRAGAGTPRAPS